MCPQSAAETVILTVCCNAFSCCWQRHTGFCGKRTMPRYLQGIQDRQSSPQDPLELNNITCLLHAVTLRLVFVPSSRQLYCSVCLLLECLGSRQWPEQAQHQGRGRVWLRYVFYFKMQGRIDTKICRPCGDQTYNLSGSYLLTKLCKSIGPLASPLTK